MNLLMNKTLRLILISVLLSAVAAAPANQDTVGTEDQLRQEALALREEAERARMDAEQARREARKAAESARQTARLRAELEREEAVSARENTVVQIEEKWRRERALQEEEVERAREELSRAHRELREASREVAQAHRELARPHQLRFSTDFVNLGDRAVIGVVLGNETEAGVKIIGVSPDGPAERAGLQQGDVLMSINGTELASAQPPARLAIREIMAEVEDGDELEVVVNRDGEPLAYALTAERREPRGWQSMIRIPEVEVVEGVDGSSEIIVEHIEIPEIDEAALTARVAELTERLKTKKFVYSTPDGENIRHYEFHIEDFSEAGEHAMNEAEIWFGLPLAHGLELAEINEGLGSYFKTDRGVLVIKAREDNAWQLESGDVILRVDESNVDSPADLMRALREVKAGSEVDITIKRNRRDKTITVAAPENLLGLR
jgi:C-terminal processing protease CtpA/Prc